MNQRQDAVRCPKRCLLCDQTFGEAVKWTWIFGLEEEKAICDQCSSALQRIRVIGCEECGRPGMMVPNPSEEADRLQQELALTGGRRAELCDDCEKWRTIPPWDRLSFRHRALYIYNPFLQEVLARFKFRGDAAIARVFTGDLRALAGRVCRYDIVTAIPLKEKRQWERGFNQTELLAECFSSVPLLQRISSSEAKQSKRGRRERLDAVKGAFRLADKYRRNVQGKRILIVDDVYTTGATLRSAAEAIYEAGATEVAAITVARSVGKST
ncbi:competence protein ComFC [Evansella caseinilytica]|uniref:Competence protein ComFC n=1 Tax=Evansella caseinilytica TaxID=1503961 RepID=A0A1H3S6F3_9BACI|nr:ComF family protein [Evansella caseinilytica]SDZ33300.1 competence protein ComFC [Evansella caseinilytica]